MTTQERLVALLEAVKQADDTPFQGRVFDEVVPAGQPLPFVVITLLPGPQVATLQADHSGDLAENWRIDIWSRTSKERLLYDSRLQSALGCVDWCLSISGATHLEEADFRTTDAEGLVETRLKAPTPREGASNVRRIIRTYQLTHFPLVEA